jgi:hypothetical protein
MFEAGKSRTRAFSVFNPIQKRNKVGNWETYLHEIDTVFYDINSNVTVDDVRKSLIDHDGYNPSIRVIEQ